MTKTQSRSTLSSAFTRIIDNTQLDIFNAWQAGAFIGDVNGKPAKWGVYEREVGAPLIAEVAEEIEPAFLSLRKSEAIDWLIIRQESLEEQSSNDPTPAENAEVDGN
jgi:hypothetical protein